MPPPPPPGMMVRGPPMPMHRVGMAQPFIGHHPPMQRPQMPMGNQP